MIDLRYEYMRNEIIFDLFEAKLILEEVAKPPRTTDTCCEPPSVLELVDELFWEML